MQPANDLTKRTITVTGHGEANAAPDEAHINVGVNVIAPTAREANTQAARAMAALIAVLMQNGIEGSSVQTGIIFIRPQFDSPPNKAPRRVGHNATNTVQVTTDALDKVGAMLDALVDAGGDNITLNNIQFSLRDPSTIQDSARLAAVADARRQAEQIAGACGVTLGNVLSVRSADFARPRMGPYVSFGAAKTAPSTPVEAGAIEVSIDLEVVYEIA